MVVTSVLKQKICGAAAGKSVVNKSILAVAFEEFCFQKNLRRKFTLERNAPVDVSRCQQGFAIDRERGQNRAVQISSWIEEIVVSRTLQRRCDKRQGRRFVDDADAG